MDFSLFVDRSEFVSAMKSIAKMTRNRPGEQALLSFEDQALVVEFPGGGMEIPAKGVWKGQIRIPLKALIHYSGLVPEQDPVPITAEDGRLRLGTTSYSCLIQPVAIKYPSLPLDAPLWAILGLRMEYSDETLEAAGLLNKVEWAETRREKLTERAAKILSPLAVREEDLIDLITECIERRIGLGEAPK